MAVVLIGSLILFTLFIIFIGSPFSLWFQALVSGAQIGLLNIILLRFRKVPPKLIVDALITATKGGILVKPDELEAHYLSHGNVMNVVQAVVAAGKIGIDLSFKRACAMDLAGIDALEAVQTTINPKVVSTPKINAAAKDREKISAVVNLTVRANIDRLPGGAGVDTVIARTVEAVIELISSQENSARVFQNPDMISQQILQRGVDAGTAYEILSVDLAEITKEQV